MAEISAKDVSTLRAKTGCGMMECKKALKESDGNFEEAVKILREKGLSVAAKKADRIAAEGIVDIMFDEATSTAVMIEVNAETDFVAKNDTFVEFVKDVSKTILKNKPTNVEELMTENLIGSEYTVEASLKDKIFTIGENMNIRRFVVVEGLVSTYIHGKGSIGVIIKFEADDVAKSNVGFAEFAKNIALQVAALPVPYLNKESVPQAAIDEEKEILMVQIKNDPANSKKPENIIEKMIAGKIGKFYENNCLTEQSYVKDDSLTVGKYVDATAKEFGGNITINSFYRFEKGEGIQKREDNFGEEIAKMINN